MRNRQKSRFSANFSAPAGVCRKRKRSMVEKMRKTWFSDPAVRETFRGAVHHSDGKGFLYADRRAG